MNPEQILLVRSSWSTLGDHVDELSTRFYAHLFEIDQSAARLFSGVDMTAQRHKLAQTLGVVVHALDDLDRLLPAVAALGKRHTQYGVEHHHFESVGEALLLALADSLGADFTPDMRAAWSDAYAIVSSVMRRALMRRESGRETGGGSIPRVFSWE